MDEWNDTPAESEMSNQHSKNGPDADMTFETAIKRLEKIVEHLEAGDVALEQSIALFQEGMALSKRCHEQLQVVEKNVHQLIEENGSLTRKPYETGEDPS